MMQFLETALNNEQLKIALSLDKNTLVIAGPGSGKTRLLVHRIAYQIFTTRNSDSKILCLTFTNEAAKELQIRLSKLLPSDLRERLWIGNFHQFGHHLLRHYAHLLGVSRDSEIIDEDGVIDILEETLSEMKENVDHDKLSILARNINRYRGKVNMPDPSELVGISAEIGSIMAKYDAIKRKMKVFDFDDLIELPLNLIRRNPNLKKLLADTFRYIFIDELQDTSLLQLELLKEIVDPEKCIIFGVADQDQILYEWRDARAETIHEFIQSFKADVDFLILNHRSPQEIVDVINALIVNNSDRFDKELKSALLNEKGYVFHHKAHRPEDEAEFVASNIMSEVNLNGRKFGDFAILFRMSWSMKEIKRALTDMSIPFCVIGDKNLQSSSLSKIIKSSISIISGQPYSKAKFIKSLQNFFQEKDIKFNNIDGIIEAIESLKNIQVSDIFANLLKITGIDTLGTKSSFQNDLTIIRKIIGLAIGEGVSSARDLSTLLSMEWSRLQDKILKSEEAVKIMTIHQSKGLEFPVVYIMRLEDGILPHKVNGKIENLEEERRILFVALSRAKSKIVMSHSEFDQYGRNTHPSRFFNDMKAVNIEEI